MTSEVVEMKRSRTVAKPKIVSRPIVRVSMGGTLAQVANSYDLPFGRQLCDVREYTRALRQENHVIIVVRIISDARIQVPFVARVKEQAIQWLEGHKAVWDEIELEIG